MITSNPNAFEITTVLKWKAGVTEIDILALLESLAVWLAVKLVWQEQNRPFEQFQGLKNWLCLLFKTQFLDASWRKGDTLNQLKVARAPGCVESAEGSLIVLIRKVLLLLAITHIWPSQNGEIFSCSRFICFTQGKTLGAYNETLKGRANKWCSQIMVASWHCHHHRSSALIYKHCPIGFGAITKPIGMTHWMAVESDLLKKTER